MTLKQLLDTIGDMGIKQKLIRFSAAGTSLAQLNPMTIDSYPFLFSSPTGTHQIKQDVKIFDLTLYYCDRLLEDYSNDIDILSSSIENLQNLINGIKQVPGVVEVESVYAIRNFANTEKLNDRLAGAYANVKITVVNDSTCYIEPDTE